MAKKSEKERVVKSLEDFLLQRNYANRLMEYELENDQGVYKIKYRPLTIAEFGELRLKCKTSDGNIDDVRFNCEVMVTCIKEPNFNNMDLVQKANCKTPMQFVSTMFSPMEVQTIAAVILSCSGVDVKSQNQVVEEVKNL